MIEQALRSHYEKIFVTPIIHRLSTRLTPNGLTWAGGTLGILVAPFLITGHPTIAIILLALSGHCDILDGALARLQGCSSSWGTVLDIVMDRVVEVSTIIALWAVDPSSRSFSCLCIVSCILLCITSFLTVGIFSDQQTEKSFDYSPGLIERAEAFLFFAFMIGCPSWFAELSFIFCILVLYTSVSRLWQFRSQASALPQ